MTPAEAKACAEFLGGSYRYNEKYNQFMRLCDFLDDAQLHYALLLRAQELGLEPIVSYEINKWEAEFLPPKGTYSYATASNPLIAMVAVVAEYMEGKK